MSFEIEDGPRGKFATSVRPGQGALTGIDDRSNDTGLGADEYYDVLSVEEFKCTITEILLDIAPAITGEQIKQVRTKFEALARKHGWVES